MIYGKVLLAAVLTMTAVTPAEAGDPVARAEYTLGDAIFHIEGFHNYDGGLADLELTAAVHYPRKLRANHPLVLLAHGLWETCEDDRVPQRGSWPCEPGTPSVPNYRGYDYLGRELARQGFVAVSISVNGVNAGEQGQPQDRARALLMNKHLAMWQRLATDGGGELAGKLPADFRGKVDLTNVGTLGHSRGGRGVVWQASDNHAELLPPGVRIRAVIPFAAVTYIAPDEDYRITKVPFAPIEGTCDRGGGGGAVQYLENSRGRNTVPMHLIRFQGANHNFFNTVWSPSGGHMFAYDDAKRPEPGKCEEDDGKVVPQRTESEQRRLATAYVSAVFQRYLLGDKKFDPMLSTGKPGVDVVREAPIRS